MAASENNLVFAKFTNNKTGTKQEQNENEKKTKKLLPKKVCAKLGSTKMIFMEKCAIIFREPFI